MDEQEKEKENKLEENISEKLNIDEDVEWDEDLLSQADFDLDEEGDFGSYVSGADDANDDYKKGYKLYNFRRPDKFSKEHLRGLQDIHKEFSRQLSMVLTAYLQMNIEIDVVSVDQLTYDEFVRSMPSPITIGVIELTPLPRQILLGISFEVLSAIVDRMLGGVGISENTHRELTDIEEALSKKMIERTVKTLESAWANVMPVSGQIVGLDNTYSSIQVATAGEIVALITFEVQISGQHYGLLSLCFPYPVLEGVLSQLSTQHFFQTKGIVATDEEKQKMIEKLNPSNVEIKVLFGSTEISTKEFLDLRVGDVIKLNNEITEEVIVAVNDEKKFFARPGTLKNNMCVKITDRYDALKHTLGKYI